MIKEITVMASKMIFLLLYMWDFFINLVASPDHPIKRLPPTSFLGQINTSCAAQCIYTYSDDNGERRPEGSLAKKQALNWRHLVSIIFGSHRLPSSHIILTLCCGCGDCMDLVSCMSKHGPDEDDKKTLDVQLTNYMWDAACGCWPN